MKLDTKELKNISLLYVDDEIEILTNIKKLYGKIFKQLFTATNGIEGIEVYKQHENDIDIIVSDINMPDMDGLEMIGKIKEIANKSFPVIVTTAHTDSEYMLNAFALQVDKYIAKPVQIKELTVDIVNLVLKYRKINNLEVLSKGLVAQNSKIDLHNQTLQQQLQFKEKELAYYKNIVDNFVLELQTNSKGKIEYCSNKFLRFFEYALDDIIGKDIKELRCEKCNSQTFQQLMLQVVHTKKTVSTNMILRTNNEKKIYTSVTIAPKYGSDQLIQGYIVFIDYLNTNQTIPTDN